MVLHDMPFPHSLLSTREGRRANEFLAACGGEKPGCNIPWLISALVLVFVPVKVHSLWGFLASTHRVWLVSIRHDSTGTSVKSAAAVMELARRSRQAHAVVCHRLDAHACFLGPSSAPGSVSSSAQL